MDETQAKTTNRRNVVTGVGLLAAGAVAGAVLAGTLAAGAASPSPSPSGSSTTESGGTSGQGDQRNCPGGHDRDGLGRHRLHLTGTVTAVGPKTVTVKTASGTTTYTVNANSDIDKNGEASLSKLVVGDKVRFSVRNGTTTIFRLHAGDEAKDRPQGGQPGASYGSGGNA